MEIALDEGAKIRNLSQLIVLLRTSHLLDYSLGKMCSHLDLMREKFCSNKRSSPYSKTISVMARTRQLLERQKDLQLCIIYKDANTNNQDEGIETSCYQVHGLRCGFGLLSFNIFSRLLPVFLCFGKV